MDDSLEDSLAAWEANADFWDEQMGDTSNRFHLEVVRPALDELLDVRQGDKVLDVACGNGNYAAYLAKQGAEVVAFDYSRNMIALAEKRQGKQAGLTFALADATKEDELLALQQGSAYDKSVAAMALMDISDISTLFRCLRILLKKDGCFVFALQHPCFVTLSERYMSAHSYYGIAIEGQPKKQCYYHRSLQELFSHCFQNGFVIDALKERCYLDKEKPEVLVVRARKI